MPSNDSPLLNRLLLPLTHILAALTILIAILVLSHPIIILPYSMPIFYSPLSQYSLQSSSSAIPSSFYHTPCPSSTRRSHNSHSQSSSSAIPSFCHTPCPSSTRRSHNTHSQSSRPQPFHHSAILHAHLLLSALTIIIPILVLSHPIILPYSMPIFYSPLSQYSFPILSSSAIPSFCHTPCPSSTLRSHNNHPNPRPQPSHHSAILHAHLLLSALTIIIPILVLSHPIILPYSMPIFYSPLSQYSSQSSSSAIPSFCYTPCPSSTLRSHNTHPNPRPQPSHHSAILHAHLLSLSVNVPNAPRRTKVHEFNHECPMVPLFSTQEVSGAPLTGVMVDERTVHSTSDL
ncbi:hypothetical protein WDU94_012578 [Cyamophila willieti]